MKRTLMKLFSMALVVIMMLSLGACGKKEPKVPTDPNRIVIGDYEALYQKAEIMKDYDGDDALVLTYQFTNNSKKAACYAWNIFEKAFQDGIELDTTTIYVSEDSYETLTNSQLTEIQPGKTLEIKSNYKLRDMEHPVEIQYSDLLDKYTANLTIDLAKAERLEADNAGDSAKENSDEDTKADTEKNGEEDSLLTWWNGSWYGWWMVSSCDGEYEDADGTWWDCCAIIDIGDDYTGSIEIWDHETERGSGVGYATVSLNEAGTGEHGTMYSEDGVFVDAELEHADWIVDPGLMDYDDMICIDGWYEGDEGSYKYEIYLRPWGTLWDDVAADNPDNLPYYYESWYLPLVNAGKEMPEKLSVDDIPDNGTSAEAEEETGTGNDPAQPQATGSIVDKSIDLKTFFGNFPTTVKLNFPEGIWCVDDRSSYRIDIYNCPTYDDRPYETPWITIELKESQEEIDTYKDSFQNLTDIDGRTIGGVTMTGRMYKYIGIDGIHEYYGQVSTGAWVSICIYYQELMDDNTLAEMEAILASITFQ